LLAALAAAGMMVFASFARTFKEGQSQITPFYMLAFLPMLLLQSPGVRLDARTALIPVANVMLLVRGAIDGTLAWHATAVTVLASLVFIAALIALAVFVLRFEDVVVGSYQGSLVKLLRTRLARRRNATASIGDRTHE
jgi:sodium transport system permease protein